MRGRGDSNSSIDFQGDFSDSEGNFDYQSSDESLDPQWSYRVHQLDSKGIDTWIKNSIEAYKGRARSEGLFTTHRSTDRCNRLMGIVYVVDYKDKVRLLRDYFQERRNEKMSLHSLDYCLVVRAHESLVSFQYESHREEEIKTTIPDRVNLYPIKHTLFCAAAFFMGGGKSAKQGWEFLSEKRGKGLADHAVQRESIYLNLDRIYKELEKKDDLNQNLGQQVNPFSASLQNRS